MIVMPGVAFDRSFSRLGYGKGFYDRFLSTYSGITSNVSTPSLDTTAEAYTSATGAQPVFTDPSAIAAATRRPIPKLGMYHRVTYDWHHIYLHRSRCSFGRSSIG